jgi:hypothetical protein
VVDTSREHRLKRLRALIAQLERLPATAERDRMLREVRGRLVDVDTGTPPSALLSDGVESVLAVTPRLSPKQAAPRVTEPAPAPERRPPRPKPLPERPVEKPPSEPARREPVEFVADVLLSLDDSTPFWPDDDEPGLAPWTRGLRG